MGRLWQWRPELLDEAQLLEAWAEALPRLGRPGQPSELHAYVHVPFCAGRCRFCGYWSTELGNARQADRYVAALVDRMRRWRARLGQVPASHAYFGGGTPSLLSVEQLQSLLDGFRHLVQIDKTFTVEGNPRSLTVRKLAVLQEAGVNRISLGVQALDPGVRAVIGRRHTSTGTIGRLIAAAQPAIGVNVDLVLGLPSQSVDVFRRDLLDVMSLRPDRITVYRYLSVPKLPSSPSTALRFGTVIDKGLIWRALRRGYALLPYDGDDGWCVDFYRSSQATWRELRGMAEQALANRLLHRHVGSNYDCFDSVYSQLMGLGPGSHSRLHGQGWVREVTAMDAVAAGRHAVYCGSRFSRQEECDIFTLQELCAGRWVSLARLRRDFGDEAAVHAASLCDAAAVESRRGRLRLRADAPAASREAALLRLAPGRCTGQLRRDGHADPRWAALNPQLLPPASVPEPEERDAVSAQPQHRPPDLVAPLASQETTLTRWLRLLAVGAPGDSVGAGTLLSASGDRVVLRLAPEPAPALEIQVIEPHQGRYYGRSARFAIGWVRRPEPLTADEDRFLKELVARMRQLDPVGDDGAGSATPPSRERD